MYASTLVFPDLYKAWEILEVQTLPPNTHEGLCCCAISILQRFYGYGSFFLHFFFSSMSHTESYMHTRSIMHSYAHWVIHLLFHLFVCSRIHFYTYPYTYSVPHSLIHTLTLAHSLTPSFAGNHTHVYISSIY